MKAVIIEIKKGKAAALTQNYGIRTIKDKGYTVGQKVEIPDGKRSNVFFTFKRLAIAAMLIVIIATGSLFSVNYYNANYTSYYTVNIDINPSTKLYINSKDIIYKVEALNDDANKIDINSLKSKSLEDGLKQYITLCKDEELISDGATVSIDINFFNADTDINSILNSVEITVNGYLETEGINMTVIIDYEDNVQRENKKEKKVTG